jgi:hypothetical protein
MPISLISGGALTGGINNGGSVTLTFPAGVLQDDVVYVCSGIDGTATIATSGYTPINNATSVNQQTRVWRKIMGATPDTSVTINGTGQPQDAHTVVALILRGVETTQPEDATPTTASGSSTNPNNPAITTVFNRAWVLTFASSEVNDTTITAPSGYTNQTNIAVSDTNPSTTAVATKEITPPGVEDPPSWTNWAAGDWAAITVAVRPAGFISVLVTGVSGTGQVGTVQVFENEQVSVTGVSGAGDVGNVQIALPKQVLVTGLSATCEAGDVAVTGQAFIEPIGVDGTVEIGQVQIVALALFSVTGVSSTGEIGDVDVFTGLAVFANGVLCTAQLGEIAVWISINDEQVSNWVEILP